MPTYEYECEACDHRFEKLQPITAGPLKKCPACGRLRLRRLIGAGGGVIFKGSGFYQTDYRSDSYRKAAENDSPPADKGSDKKGHSSKPSPPAKPDKPAKGADTK